VLKKALIRHPKRGRKSISNHCGEVGSGAPPKSTLLLLYHGLGTIQSPGYSVDKVRSHTEGFKFRRLPFEAFGMILPEAFNSVPAL